MSPQNRRVFVAGCLLTALSLPGCSLFEKIGGAPEHNNRAIVILLTICPGASIAYNSPSSDVVVTKSSITRPPVDKIGLNSATGDLDLTSLVVAKGTGDDRSRHVDITYALETPCPNNKRYSYYFLNDPKPIKGKDDDPVGQLKPHSFDNGATSVSVGYNNKTASGSENFRFHINYTVVETVGGVEGPPSNQTTPDPNIKNTPVNQ